MLKYFPPVRSQGSLNSCAQFASVYYTLTHMTAMARNWNWSLALAISDKDDIVGSSADRKGVEKPCVYGENNVIALDTLGGERGRVESINQAGVSVGWSQNQVAEVRATLWSGTGEVVDLNGLIPPDSGWVLESASTIDDEGVINGRGTFNGQRRDFALVPRK